MRKLFFAIAALLFSVSAFAAVPDMYGIAKMTYRISSVEMVRDYYGRFLGFDEAFSYPSDKGTVYAFKVNDRQFIEFYVDNEAPSRKDKLASVSIQVASAEKMHEFLVEKKWPVSEVSTDGAGEKVVSTKDADGNVIEFVEFTANGKHMKCAGKYLSDKRISTRIHHAGLPAGKIDGEDPFWIKLLGGKEIVRYEGERGIHYITIGLGTECVEHYYPSDVSFGHVCFQTMDMQETLMTLYSRGGYKMSKPSIGMTKRWNLNIFTPEGAKVEFAEPYSLR
jgi:catechol 2,3-dioxygenase-like lactoylglutathione lyase family enzyme